MFQYFVTDNCLRQYRRQILGQPERRYLSGIEISDLRRRVIRDLHEAKRLTPMERIAFSKRFIDPRLDHLLVGDRVYAVKQKSAKRPTIVTTVIRVDEPLTRVLESLRERDAPPESGTLERRPRSVIVSPDVIPLLQRVFGPRSREEISRLANQSLEHASRLVPQDCRRTVLGQEPVAGADYWQSGRLLLGVSEGLLVDAVYRRQRRAA